MTHFIFGRAGSGKSTRIFDLAAKSLISGRHTFLIVPEQQAVSAEQHMADLLSDYSGEEDSPELSLEILNFKRLTNRVFREYGGLSYNYISDAGKSLLMWRALSELSDELSEYGGKTDRSRVDLMLSTVSEFKAYRVTPAGIERTLEGLDDSPLKTKLSDISLIYSDYLSLISLLDDADDDLTKAAKKLETHNFFSGCDVYFDSFNGFTPQEFEIIRVAARSAKSLTISLTLGEGTPFENLADTAAKLKRIAGDFTEEFLDSDLRHKTAGLKLLESSLWDPTAKSDLVPDEIKVIECPNQFAECEAVAVEILKKVRAGASYRDFAVTTRGADRYDGMIDLILEKYGIPCFFSKRSDLTEKPLIRLILSAYSIYVGGYAASDVITFMKTGLTDLSTDEASDLTRYAERWRIRGKKLWSRDFILNPNGWTAEPTEESAAELEVLNESRKKLMAPLSKFHEKLSAARNVREHSTALYDFLVDLQIPGKLELRKNAAEPEEASELSQLWAAVIDSLDELVSVVPELEADAETYTKLLGIVFGNVDIGSIPAAVDAVVVGDASLLRANAKHIYVIGANEGVFPAAPDSGGLFTDSDRETLAKLGVELAGGGEYRTNDERFTFYRALTAASESLTLCYASADLSGRSMRPSFGAIRIMKLFPSLKVVKYDELPLEYRLEGRPKLLEYAAEAAGTPLGDALSEYLEGSEKLEKLSLPLTEDEAILSEDTAKLIAEADLTLTQSRLDSYVLCKFSYFCKFVLKLEESKPIDFDSADIGIFIHKILEIFVSNDKLSAEEVDPLVDEIVDDYIKRLAVTDEPRLSHLFVKLRKTSKLLCRNIAGEFGQSEFKPTFFELPITFPDGAADKFVPPLEIELFDGTKACICGIADRVDTFRHDGKLYVRVVDYKTGTKEFSMDDIALGLNLQMLLYLFSIWKNGAKKGGAFQTTDEIIPAGVLYFGANVPTLTLDAELPPTEVERLVSDKLSRRGILLDDREVLEAMERELHGKYLPLKTKKDGSFTNSDALKTLEDFGSLLGSIESTIRKIGSEMKRGNVSARPMKTKKHDACRFCPMKPVCRKTE